MSHELSKSMCFGIFIDNMFCKIIEFVFSEIDIASLAVIFNLILFHQLDFSDMLLFFFVSHQENDWVGN